MTPDYYFMARLIGSLHPIYFSGFRLQIWQGLAPYGGQNADELWFRVVNRMSPRDDLVSQVSRILMEV